MGATPQEIKRYETRINGCTTMTDLLVAMSSWQSFADSRGLSGEERASVDAAYMKAESRLITQVKATPW